MGSRRFWLGTEAAASHSRSSQCEWHDDLSIGISSSLKKSSITSASPSRVYTAMFGGLMQTVLVRLLSMTATRSALRRSEHRCPGFRSKPIRSSRISTRSALLVVTSSGLAPAMNNVTLVKVADEAVARDHGQRGFDVLPQRSVVQMSPVETYLDHRNRIGQRLRDTSPFGEA